MDNREHTVTLPIREYQQLVADSDKLNASMTVNDMVVNQAAKMFNSFADEIERKLFAGTCNVSQLTSMIRKQAADKEFMNAMLCQD